ncbi:MAG: hypothetical protein COA79_04275 [Planctomycetota bacterium]|nr:MAG: hypothetical protein COA79_04275 [Planctomycetota bacterium]
MKAINQFLLENDILIKDNPCVSVDYTLHFESLLEAIKKDESHFESSMSKEGEISVELENINFYPKSKIQLKTAAMYIVESKATGDCALITYSGDSFQFENSVILDSSLQVFPMEWENLIHLKNITQEDDSNVTIFPKATPHLKNTSLGIGARFTTLHWPAVAWSMSTLNLELTANQNSIPRELVFDVDEMLNDNLADVPFPFIGGTVPEGHQGQSVNGMTYGSIITYLKLGFHQNKIAYGFNADHQPIGGRFDKTETELVEGSLFASYITYDLSPELANHEIIEDDAKLEEKFNAIVDQEIFAGIKDKLSSLNLSMNEKQLKQLITYITPAMEKMLKRDALYTEIRNKKFTTEVGQSFVKELSIDELPGQTTSETLTACLAMSELMGVSFDFVAPNIGFQKNFPYPDNVELREKVSVLYTIAEKFGVSFGFHSGSGKSAENYTVVGEVTKGNLEIKTSGRYTYEMGVALSKSSNEFDQKLWKDWYEFTKELALDGAFSSNEVQKNFAIEFIQKSFETENKSSEGIFADKDSLKTALDTLSASPDHMHWFEYNFLYVLAAEGSTKQLGNHLKPGYDQRKRFYAISEEGKLLFAKGIASYIIFLAETTGISNSETIANAKEKLSNIDNFDTLLAQVL